MKEITASKDLVAYCGLYCGACSSYLKGSCPGCRENTKAGWCKVRACCGERSYASCAECTEFGAPNDCSKFGTIVSKLIGLVTGSSRQACVFKIREFGLDGYAQLMTRRKRHSLPRIP
jgi:hypothetical protein